MAKKLNTFGAVHSLVHNASIVGTMGHVDEIRLEK